MISAKLYSCIEVLRNIVGDTFPEQALTDACIKADFDPERAANDILNGGEAAAEPTSTRKAAAELTSTREAATESACTRESGTESTCIRELPIVISRCFELFIAL